jgi:hypothetical protein
MQVFTGPVVLGSYPLCVPRHSDMSGGASASPHQHHGSRHPLLSGQNSLPIHEISLQFTRSNKPRCLKVKKKKSL